MQTVCKTNGKSKVEIAYDYILDRLISNQYQHGEKLVISRIARECHVSEIPVREALRRLESEGYVGPNASGGFAAIGINVDTIREIVQNKGVLEGYAARLSVDYLTVADMRELRAINERMKDAAARRDMEACYRYNREFHQRMVRRIPQKILLKMINDLWEKWHITKRVFSESSNSLDLSYHEHSQILRMIEEREYDKVEMLVRAHKFRAANQLTDDQ